MFCGAKKGETGQSRKMVQKMLGDGERAKATI
jgi:hypothetical protein